LDYLFHVADLIAETSLFRLWLGHLAKGGWPTYLDLTILWQLHFWGAQICIPHSEEDLVYAIFIIMPSRLIGQKQWVLA